jgi:hypothetical protein
VLPPVPEDLLLELRVVYPVAEFLEHRSTVIVRDCA